MKDPAGRTESINPIGNLKVYLWCLYCGTTLFIVGIMRLNTGSQGSGTILTGVGFILLLTASVIVFIRLFQLWRLVIGLSPFLGLIPSVRTPGRAVGYLFIPMFNLYWVFVALGKLPRDLNAMAHASDTPTRVPTGLGLAAAILSVISVIPFVGQVAGAVNGLVLLPLFLTGAVSLSREIAGKIAAAGETGDAIPVLEERQDIRNLADLMDPGKFGIRAGAGLAFPAARLSAHLLYLLALAPFGYFLHGAFYKIALGQIIIGVLTGVLFVVAGSLIRRSWMLPVAWGLVWIPMDFVTRYVLYYFRPDREPQELTTFILNPSVMFSSFLGGVLFMAALVLVVRFWGLRPWSLIAGLWGFHFLSSLPQWIMRSHRIFDFGFHSFFAQIILPILELSVLGIVLYYGLRPPRMYSGQNGSRELDI